MSYSNCKSARHHGPNRTTQAEISNGFWLRYAGRVTFFKALERAGTLDGGLRRTEQGARHQADITSISFSSKSPRNNDIHCLSFAPYSLQL